MKRNKVLSLGLAAVMMLTAAGCNGGSKTLEGDAGTTATGSTEGSKAESSQSAGAAANGVTITILNTKAGMEKFFEPAFDDYKKKTGVTVEMTSISEGDSPYEAIQKRYAAGDAPTLAIMDCNDIVALAEQKALPLDGEKWVADGGDKYGVKVGGKLYGFPFSLEGRGLLFNRTAIEKTLGKDFDEKSIKNLDDFKAICDELVAAGMEKPVCISKEDWSLGAHYLGLMYEEQDGTSKGAEDLIGSLKDGSAKLADNARFNSLFDTFDVLMKYNINRKDPLAADYDTDNAFFAEGDVAFWFNGNWVWEVVSGFADSSSEFGMLPVVQNTKDDKFNTLVNAVGSKQIMIDKNASPEQIQAAKDFLNWLVYDKTAQDIVANQILAVQCFSTFNASPDNKLGQALKAYADAGLTFDQYNGLPGDHWSVCGGFVQKYLGGKTDRAGLAADLEGYWKSKK